MFRAAPPGQVIAVELLGSLSERLEPGAGVGLFLRVGLAGVDRIEAARQLSRELGRLARAPAPRAPRAPRPSPFRGERHCAHR